MENREQTVPKFREIALLGNPNSGKTTIFNALTGLRHSTANYPGVTVEKKIGFMTLTQSGEKICVLDLPGAYSLSPRSPDEDVVHDVLLGIQKGTPAPDLVVVVLDAGNLERNLYLTLQIIETGLPVVAVFNMWDLAESAGTQIDLGKMQERLGIPCVRTDASRGAGVNELRSAIEKALSEAVPVSARSFVAFGEKAEKVLGDLSSSVAEFLPAGRACAVRGEALRILGDGSFRSPLFKKNVRSGELRGRVMTARQVLDAEGADWRSLEAEVRYAAIEAIISETVVRRPMQAPPLSERIDRVLTHRVWGLVIFLAIMALVFQSIFNWAGLPMGAISWCLERAGSLAAAVLPDGRLKSLVIDGVIAGVGNVVIFLPQILLLFFFIALFEDFGYMARAAFVLDRIMKRSGLNGKAFLPLLSSFACAVPGVMATRTMEDRNDRIATMLVAPLMSCSARLPVYTLLIAAFVPPVRIFGILDLKGVTLFSLYFLGLLAGLVMAALFRRTLLKGERTPFLFELPPYRLPNFRNIFLVMWDRSREFLARAGGIIFWMSIILWFLASYPVNPEIRRKYDAQKAAAQASVAGEDLNARMADIERLQAGEEIRASYMGAIGRWIEPAIRPLGFDWKIGIGLVASLAAREVLVSSLAIVYNVGQTGEPVDLARAMQRETISGNGEKVYSPLVAVSLMVFFVFACQCMSTIAVVRRETASWRWPVFMLAYMTALAWFGSFVVYQGGRLLGWG